MLVNVRIVKLVVVVLLLFFTLLSGQEREKKVAITRLEIPPKIDGSLDDPCWKNMEPVSGFVQYDPVNGVPATEQTLAWMAYDAKNIYFAFHMKDSQPNKIWAELMPRNDYENNDSITVILDAYNDRRTSISFTVNPKNVQKNSVETIWRSGAVMTADGWTAEMAIPFKSLRFSTMTDQVWGVNFQRYIFRLNEIDYWTTVIRDRPLLQQMGEISGLSGIRPGRNIEFFPYLGVRSSRWGDEKDSKVAGGLDFKYGLQSNLILDITASPDFSEVESDPFIYQLAPYENYFQENRPFFTEGSQYFNLATEGDDFHGADYKLFYSRRIRNPKIAAKLTGKTAGWSFGVLGALNDGEEKDSGFSVIRVQKDILANSQVGIFYTGYDATGRHNHNAALDYKFNFKDIYYISGASIFTFADGKERGNNGMHFFGAEREADAGLRWSFDLRRIEKNAAVLTGFVTRTDVQSESFDLGYAWRYNRGQVKHFELGMDAHLEQNCDWEATARWAGISAEIDFVSQLSCELWLDAGRSRYQVRSGEDELQWTKDFISTRSANLGLFWFRGGLVKELWLDASWEQRGVYTDDFRAVVPGTQVGFEGELAFRLRSNFELGVGGEWTRQTVRETGEEVFSGATYDLSLHYQFTPSLFLATNLKGETRESQYNLDLVLGYYFGAGNIVQLVYKKSEQKEGGIGIGGDAVTLKVSYLLRI